MVDGHQLFVCADAPGRRRRPRHQGFVLRDHAAHDRREGRLRTEAVGGVGIGKRVARVGVAGPHQQHLRRQDEGPVAGRKRRLDVLGDLRLHLLRREGHERGQRLRRKVPRRPGELGIVLLRLRRCFDRCPRVREDLQRIERRHLVGETRGCRQKGGLDAGEVMHPHHFLVADLRRGGDAEDLLGGDDVDRLDQTVALMRVQSRLARLFDDRFCRERVFREVRFVIERGIDGRADQHRSEKTGQAGPAQPAQRDSAMIEEGVALAVDLDGGFDTLLDDEGLSACVWAECQRLSPHVSFRPPSSAVSDPHCRARSWTAADPDGRSTSGQRADKTWGTWPKCGVPRRRAERHGLAARNEAR